MKQIQWRRGVTLLIIFLVLGSMFWWQRPPFTGTFESAAVAHSAAGAVGGRNGARARAEAGEPRQSNLPLAAAAGATAAAPGGSSLTLFSYETLAPAQAAALDRALPAPTRALHYVRLNRALIAGKASPFWQKSGEGSVELPLVSGATLRVAIIETISLGPDRFTSTGILEGRPQSHAIFSYNEGFLHVTVQDVELGNYALRAATADLAQFYEIDDELVPACAAENAPRPVLDADAVLTLARRKATSQAESVGPAGEAPTPAVAASAGSNVTVDVMFLYTQSVLATLSGTARTAALQSFFDNATAKINRDFAASQIAARVRLVKIAEVNYNESASDVSRVQSDALLALRTTTDGKMDEIHALRDQVGADLVALILQRADSTSSGLGYVLDTPGDNLNPLYGFSVVEYAFVTGTEVVTHELGHNFGCAHNRENATAPGAYSYSYGYRLIGRDQLQYRTIMAYAPGTRLAYFSNPNLIAPAPISAPVGVPIGQTGEAYNALTVDQDAFEVANFRLQTQTATNTGTLINVATRAFSGTGEQQLIAGFIIQGTAPKKMLLRAAGPALAGAPFNVPGTLSDPQLTLYKTDVTPATQLALNDNWGTPIGAAASASELSAAAAQVGAFPFPANSRDAAILTTLTPGSYTANVESADGATGTALVEAYEVDRNGNKVFNLSTRGYADKGRELIGGFVVQAGASPTKRILIRVQGPSLAKFGLTAMSDPLMQIYNFAGDLIMKNDDWSAGATSVNGVRDDFKPTVTYYNEKQIFATGLAPGNRREPCVMADLAPGSYTVVVQPFEKLPDQVASPGVVIVEVYEVNPK